MFELKLPNLSILGFYIIISGKSTCGNSPSFWALIIADFIIFDNFEELDIIVEYKL